MAAKRPDNRAKPICNGANAMTDAAYIEDAQGWANALVRKETRGPGDQENAMRRLEARYGIPWRTFWTLKYRPPSDVFVSVYNRLHAAYRAECERQMRLLKHDLEITKAKVGVSSRAVASAEAFIAEIEGVEE